MIAVLSLFVSAHAVTVDPVWLPAAGDVSIKTNIELPSPNELELEGYPSGCASIITTHVEDGEHIAIPTRRCPRSLFEVLKEKVPEMEFEWSIPVDGIADVAIRVTPVWPSDPDDPMTMEVSDGVPGTFDPPAKMPGKIKKMSREDQSCTMRVRMHKSGQPKLEGFDGCHPKLQKHAEKALDAWRWKVPKEIVPRPLYTHVRLDWHPEVMVDGEATAMVLVSGAQPRTTEHEEKLEWPEDAPSGLDDRVLCYAEVDVSADGAADDMRTLGCEDAFIDAAEEAIMAWTWHPRSVEGELVGGTDVVRVYFDKPEDVKKAEKKAEKEAEEAEEAEESSEESSDDEGASDEE